MGVKAHPEKRDAQGRKIEAERDIFVSARKKLTAPIEALCVIFAATLSCQTAPTPRKA